MSLVQYSVVACDYCAAEFTHRALLHHQSSAVERQLLGDEPPIAALTNNGHLRDAAVAAGWAINPHNGRDMCPSCKGRR